MLTGIYYSVRRVSSTDSDRFYTERSDGWDMDGVKMPAVDETVYEPGHEKMCHDICEQQRHRSDCASTQSDQRLCCLLLSIISLRFYSRNFKTLASFCGCAGRFVSGLVGNSRRHILSCHGSYCWNLPT